MTYTNKDNSLQTVKTDGLLCSAATFLSSLLNMTEYYFQTRPNQSLNKIAKTMHENNYRGLGVNLVNFIYYHAILLTVKHYAQKSLDTINSGSSMNEEVAGFVGGTAALVASYPVSVVQALRCEGTTIADIRNIKKDTLFRGFGASCLGDGFFYSTYFGIHALLLNYSANYQSRKKDMAIDTISGLFAGIVCNPFYVVSNCQKITNKKMIQQTKTLFKEGGVKRFYTGFGTVSLLNLGLFGLTAGAGDRLVKHLFEKSKTGFGA